MHLLHIITDIWHSFANILYIRIIFNNVPVWRNYQVKYTSCLHLKCLFNEYFQLAITRKGDKNTPHLYDIDGTEALGSYLCVYPCSDSAPELSECAIQWYRSTSEDGKKELISGIRALIHCS